MLINGIQVQRYVKASAGRSNLSVVFEECDHPRHDGSTIYLPRITHKTTEEELKQLMASTDHEVAHDRFSDFDILHEKDMDRTKLLMFIWNFLEDSRVNVIEAREYLGFRENYDECTVKLIERILEEASTNKDFFPQLVIALAVWETRISSRWFPLCELAAGHHTPDKKIFDVLNNFSDELAECQSILPKKEGSKATYLLAKAILKDLEKECGKVVEVKVVSSELGKDKGKEKGTEKSKSKPKPKSSEASEDAEADSGGGEAEDGDADLDKDPPEPPDDEEYKVITVKLTEEDLAKFSLSMPEHGRKMGHIGMNFEPVAIHSEAWDLTDYDNFIVVDYPGYIGHRQYFDTPKLGISFQESYQLEVGRKLIAQENFAQQVRRLIQIRAKVQTQYGVKRGKLDQSRLSRICFDAPGFNERIFKRKIENKTLDAAITVLVDMSGSMSGEKAYYALASTLLINEVCSVINIPLEILGFTDDANREKGGITAPLMFIYKGFHNLHVSNENIVNYFALSSRHMVGNPDGECVIWAHDRLVHRKERKKMLIVMSDGSPAASKGSYGLEKFTKQAITEIEKGGVVDIYGLGLLSSSVTHYYTHNSVVNKVEAIPTKLLELIERKLLT